MELLGAPGSGLSLALTCRVICFPFRTLLPPRHCCPQALPSRHPQWPGCSGPLRALSRGVSAKRHPRGARVQLAHSLHCCYGTWPDQMLPKTPFNLSSL